jgi:tetratricopeptide (TPR) repeat protein
MRGFVACALMVGSLTGAICAQMGVVQSRGRLGIENPIYRLHADEVSRADYVSSFGLYLPKGDFARAAGAFLGGLRADAYWLKAAQYVSKSFDDPALKSRFLGDLYLAMIDADPYWSTGAETAANAVDAVDRKHEQAIEILNRALKERPDQWRLWYTKMGIYLFWPGHKAEATRAALAGSRTPDASPALLDAANSLANEDADYKLAVEIAERRVEHYGLTSRFGAIAWRDLLEHTARFSERLLNKQVVSYKVKFNKLPAGLQDLVETKLMEQVPPEPYKMKWIYDPRTGAVYSEGLVILEGARMRLILTSLVSAYERHHKRLPKDLKEAFDAECMRSTDPELVRLFGSPPRLLDHPLLGPWKYDADNGQIALPEGYDLKDSGKRADELREKLIDKQ